jgi:hypothetical protein
MWLEVRLYVLVSQRDMTGLFVSSYESHGVAPSPIGSLHRLHAARPMRSDVLQLGPIPIFTYEP